MSFYNKERLLTHRNILFKTTSDATLIVDSNGHLLKTNPAFNKLLGYEEDELRGKLFTDIIHNNTLVKERTSHSRLHHFQRSSELPMEMELINREGHTISIILRSILIKNNNSTVVEAIGIAEDLREHKRTEKLEQRVWETKETLHNILTNSGDAILVVDANGKITIFNEAILQMLGYKEDEIIGKHLTEISPYTGDFITTIGEKVSITEEYVNYQVEKANELFKKGNLTNYEIYLLRKDGILLPTEATCSILNDQKGERRGSIVIARDISDRKQTEKMLQKAHNELEKRVEERTANLKAANEQLKQEITERKRVEKILISYQEQLRSLASELSLTEERERQRIATDLHDRIGQALAISKMKIGVLRKSVHSKDHVDSLSEIHNLIAQTIKDTRSLIFELMPPVLYELGFESALDWLFKQIQEQYPITIDCEDDNQPKPLHCDIRVFLFRAVRELLINIAKHAQTQNARICTSRDGDTIRITVEDDGIGFDISKIGPHTGRTGGFGLLNIRERLNYLGGHITIDSQLGHGTRITLTAPFTCTSETIKD